MTVMMVKVLSVNFKHLYSCMCKALSTRDSLHFYSLYQDITESIFHVLN